MYMSYVTAACPVWVFRQLFPPRRHQIVHERAPSSTRATLVGLVRVFIGNYSPSAIIKLSYSNLLYVLSMCSKATIRPAPSLTRVIVVCPVYVFIDNYSPRAIINPCDSRMSCLCVYRQPFAPRHRQLV